MSHDSLGFHQGRIRTGMTVGGKTEIRLGSPTGLILGEFDTFEARTTPVKVRLRKKVSGFQKVYLVFKNAKNDGKPLFSVHSVEFMME